MFYPHSLSIYLFAPDDLLIVGGCKATEHGCCPDRVTAADGPLFLGCPSEDRIPTGLCVESSFGCCLDGLTASQGPFLYGCPDYTCRVRYTIHATLTTVAIVINQFERFLNLGTLKFRKSVNTRQVFRIWNQIRKLLMYIKKCCLFCLSILDEYQC